MIIKHIIIGMNILLNNQYNPIIYIILYPANYIDIIYGNATNKKHI
jgi:hypothetical protein